MGALSALTSWLPGGGIVKAISGAVSAWQDRKAAKQAHQAEWEVVQAKRSSTVLRWATFLILWGPIGHAYYLAITAAPIESPQDVATAVQATFSAFPPWWTGGAMTILLAVWGIREAGHNGITKAAMRRKEKEAEAEVERAKHPERGGR
jgi:hypothetical protein